MTNQTDTNGQWERVEFKRTATAADYTAKVTDALIAVTDTSSSRVITIPSSIVIEGHALYIKDESGAAGTNAISLYSESGETFDNDNGTLVIGTNNESKRIYSDGSNWFTL